MANITVLHAEKYSRLIRPMLLAHADRTPHFAGRSNPFAIYPADARLPRWPGLEHWGEEIILMISLRHKLRRYTDSRFALVDLFRRSDVIDFSMGLIRLGILWNNVKQ